MSELTEDEAAIVRGWLRAHEFRNAAVTGGDSPAFGDRQEVWARDGTLFRLTRDRGQWWYDLSRAKAGYWLDVDSVAGAIGSRSTAPVERVADVATIDDRVFGALRNVVRHSP